MQLRCPKGKVLVIRKAFYGRNQGDMKACYKKSLKKYQKIIASTRCLSKKSLRMVRKRCGGRQACKITASNKLFGDPCKGVFKYLKVRYSCRASK